MQGRGAQFLRYGVMFRRRAAAEQIRRRRRDTVMSGRKRKCVIGDDVARARLCKKPHREQRPCSLCLKELVGDPEFERQGRRTAADI